MGNAERPAPGRRLDGNLKEITEAALEHLLLTYPHAEVLEKDGKKIVRIPQYSIETDESYWVERVVKPDPEGTAKFKPGDVLRHTKTGSPFNIVDPLKAFLRLRKGPKSDG